MNFEIVTVVLGALLGALISLISFTYKSRLEIKMKVNATMFHLLEIWSLIGMTRVLQGEEFSVKLISRIKFRFPEENISKEAEDAIIAGMQGAIPLLVESQQGGEDYLASYSSAVSDLAPIYPIHAYQLNKNQMLIRYLKGVDSMMTNLEVTEVDKIMVSRVKQYANKEAFDEFEKDLKDLSKKTGFLSSREFVKFIDKIKNKVNDIPDDVFDTFIDTVLAPAVQEVNDRQDS